MSRDDLISQNYILSIDLAMFADRLRGVARALQKTVEELSTLAHMVDQMEERRRQLEHESRNRLGKEDV